MQHRAIGSSVAKRETRQRILTGNTMRRRSYIAICTAVLAVLSAASAQASLTWKTRTLELDAKLADEAVRGHFEFVNQGDSPVTITSIKTSCGCTTTKLDKKTYAPGESGSIEAHFRVGDSKGTQAKKIVVRTDEKKAAVTTLTLKVNVPKVLDVSTRLLLWTDASDLGPRTIQIKSLGDQVIDSVAVRSLGDQFDVVHETIDKGTQYEVRVTPSETAGRVSKRLFLDVLLAGDVKKTFVIQAQVMVKRDAAVRN